MYRQLIAVSLAAFITAIPAHAATNETARTAQAVLAVDHHWSQAELHGDTSYLDQLLLPDYRSVSPNGIALPKASILKSARLNGSSRIRQQKILNYMSTHPSAETVALHGDMAIVTFYSPKLGPQRGITSSDVLVYENDGWHAAYSQHTMSS